MDVTKGAGVDDTTGRPGAFSSSRIVEPRLKNEKLLDSRLPPTGGL
jgi:hypothetical protein